MGSVGGGGNGTGAAQTSSTLMNTAADGTGAPSDNGACGCRVGAGHNNNGVPATLWLVASALLVRRRRAGNRTPRVRRRKQLR
jgi:hypothetical protein